MEVKTVLTNIANERIEVRTIVVVLRMKLFLIKSK